MYKFEKNSTICFFGDSITQGGKWIRSVFDYYIDVLNIPCEMYNCGVAGDKAENAITHMEDSVLFYEPTDVVIAFGMNDLGYDLYDGRAATDDVINERRKKSDEYVKNIDAIAKKLTEKNIRLSFCTPTAVDELTESKEPIHYGVTSGLRELGDRLKVLSEKYGNNVIDFHRYYDNMLKIAYREGKTINRDDRIHPNELGSVLLSQIFLHEQGYDVAIISNCKDLEKEMMKTFSDEENIRFEMEQSKSYIEFVEWRVFSGIKDREYICSDIKKRLADEKSEYVINCFNKYLTHKEDLRHLQRELKIYTKKHFNN